MSSEIPSESIDGFPIPLVLVNLLSKGYFPKELPSPFSTQGFAAAVAGGPVPAFEIPEKPKRREYTRFSLARPGTLRRPLAILNPEAFYHLARFMVENASLLLEKSQSTSFCLSSPSTNGEDSSRCISVTHGLKDLPLKRASLRIGHPYLLKTDISRFYPSIYTHAIDWAVTGKSQAKENLRTRNFNTVGARLDKLVQACQNGQTRGIPIGPDTSLVIAHLITAQCDKVLAEAGFTRGYRYIDDYEISVRSQSDAEKALSLLESSLAEFELELNPSKTKTLQLPLPIDEQAISKIRGCSIREDKVAQNLDLIALFNNACELAKEHQQLPILRYTVGRLRKYSEKIHDKQLLQNIVLQAATSEPGVWPNALPVLKSIFDNDGLDKEGLSFVIESTIQKSAPTNHSSEVSWALWTALVLEAKISIESANRVLEMQDDCCLLLLYYIIKFELTDLSIDLYKEKIAPYVDSNFKGAHWLLTYESTLEAITDQSSNDPFEEDPFFQHLRDSNVRFFDESKIESARNSDMSTYYLSDGYGSEPELEDMIQNAIDKDDF